jgi:hypothetical protein
MVRGAEIVAAAMGNDIHGGGRVSKSFQQNGARRGGGLGVAEPRPYSNTKPPRNYTEVTEAQRTTENGKGLGRVMA